VVHNVFQDRDPAGVRQELRERHGRWPLHRGHCAAVQVEAGDLFQQGGAANECRHVRVGAQDILQVRQPFLRQEKRPRLVARGQCTAQHTGGFSDVHAFNRFAELTQMDVRQLRVVGHAGVRGGFKVVDCHRVIISADWRS
jgi:hypothetical protein